MTKWFLIAAIVVSAQSAQTAPQADAGQIRVTVQDQGTAKPIAGAQVTVGAVSPQLATSASGAAAVSGVLPPRDQIAEIRIISSSFNPVQAGTGGRTEVVTHAGDIILIDSQAPAPSSLAATTDANGIATFSNLAPGKYNVRVRHAVPAGIFPAAATTLYPTSATAPVEITPQRLIHEVYLPLVRGATISGRVRDASGQGVANARVFAGVLGYRDGRRTVSVGPSTQADARGEYRLGSLGPAEYFISFTPLSTGRGPATYYPGTNDVEAATSVLIRGGEEIVGMDFDIQPPKIFGVTGQVVNLPAGSNASLTLQLRSESKPDEIGLPALLNQHSGSNGEFQINVPAGSWDLMAIVALPPGGAAQGIPRYVAGRVPLSVVDRDVEGVVIEIRSADISGRIVPTGDPVQIRLVPRENLPAGLVSHVTAPVAADSTGEFAFKAVPPGKYSIEASPSPEYFIADVRAESQSIYAEGVISIGTVPVGPLEVQVGRATAQVSGFVTPGQDFSSVRVVLIPSAPHRQNLSLYRTASVIRSDGYFSVLVPPGEYKAFAWRNLPTGGAELNPQFISSYEQFGVPVTVTTAPVSNLQVPLIP